MFKINCIFQMNMDKLPPEILEKVLISPNVNIADVVYASSTCNYLRSVVNNSNLIWKCKIIQRWPQLERILLKKTNVDFFGEVKIIYGIRGRALDILKTMSPRFYKKHELSDMDLDEWRDLINTEQHYYYLVAYLMEIVNTDSYIDSIDVVPLNTPGNKTFQYYAAKVLRFIRQLHLTNVWKKFIELPPKFQLLEIGAVFVSQWSAPNVDVDLESVQSQLDEIAEQVKVSLRETHPNHPIFKKQPSDFLQWRNENIPDHQYDPIECWNLLHTLRQVIFSQYKFRGNNEFYYMPQNSFIDQVLLHRHGLPITLSIIFEAVARRVGLKFDPINFPSHFLLRFRECGKTISCYYLDAFNEGQIVSSCPSLHVSNRDKFQPATAVQVVQRMANNLEISARQYLDPNGRITKLRSSLELLKLVNPRDIPALVNLARLYMLQNMDTKPLKQFLLQQTFEMPQLAQRIVHMLRDYDAHHERETESAQVEAAQRNAQLKFAVGMVMEHLTLKYKCVLYDWDPVCLAAAEWQRNNNVCSLKFKDLQPFYNVLVEDGSHRYVAQENLVPTTDTGFLYLIDEVGRHFSHFYKTHYVPNAEKEREYPEDRKVRLKFHIQLLAGNSSDSTADQEL